MPRLAILSDLTRAGLPGVHPASAELALARRSFWLEIARRHGWDLAFLDTADLPSLSGALAWIDLPMLSRVIYRSVFERAVRAGAREVLDLPESVETVLGLDHAYPILARAGLPVPRTALVPVDDTIASAIHSPAAVRRLLTERMYEALFEAGIDPHQGVYVRGFSSSMKSTSSEHFFGDNQTDLEATVFEVICHLRDALEVDGLALREFLDLERIALSLGPSSRDLAYVPFEVRISVIKGRAVLASYHGPFSMLVDEARHLLSAELSPRRPRIEAALATVLPALLAAPLPENYVADLVFTRAGAPMLLELNPLYAAGYNVPAAHAFVVTTLAAHLAARAGYPPLSRDDILDTVTHLVGERVENSPGVWLLDSDAHLGNPIDNPDNADNPDYPDYPS